MLKKVSQELSFFRCETEAHGRWGKQTGDLCGDFVIISTHRERELGNGITPMFR